MVYIFTPSDLDGLCTAICFSFKDNKISSSCIYIRDLYHLPELHVAGITKRKVISLRSVKFYGCSPP